MKLLKTLWILIRKDKKTIISKLGFDFINLCYELWNFLYLYFLSNLNINFYFFGFCDENKY